MLGQGRNRLSVSLWPLLIPLLVLLPSLGSFPYPSGASPFAGISDLSISHYPNAIFLQRSIIEYHQIPLWSSTILSGYPFAANPLSGLWYPIGWLALVFPLPLGFNIAVIAHLLLAGLGTYFLARAVGRSHQAALFAGLAFEAMPKLFADYGAGHLTMLYAISLTPWLMLAEIRRQERDGPYLTRQPGIVLALIALADPMWAVYAGLLWVAFLLVFDYRPWVSRIAELLKQTVIAVALASPLLLPMFEYSQLSTRAHLTPADLLVFSFPLVGLLGLLARQFGGFHEWVIYVGIGTLFLALIALVKTKKSKKELFWIATIGVGLLLSFGENIPGLALQAQLPVFSLLRVPPRVLPLVAFALILLAVRALDGLLARTLSKQDWRRVRLTFFAIVAFQLGLALVVGVISKSLPLNYLWAIGLSVIIVAAILLFSSHRISAKVIWVSLVVLSMLDLGAMDTSLFSARGRDLVLSEGAEVAKYLAQQPGQFRVYSPSYRIPQQTGAQYGLEFADGVDPLQLQTYSDYMEQAAGFRSDGYSVTLPALSKDPASEKQATPDLSKLAQLNVKYISSEFEMNLEGLKFVGRFGTTFLYEILDAQPRAWIDSSP